ncbi:MAG: hypothetical protein WC712_06610 [Candidatus Brocadiia bacterium]
MNWLGRATICFLVTAVGQIVLLAVAANLQSPGWIPLLYGLAYTGIVWLGSRAVSRDPGQFQPVAVGFLWGSVAAFAVAVPIRFGNPLFDVLALALALAGTQTVALFAVRAGILRAVPGVKSITVLGSLALLAMIAESLWLLWNPDMILALIFFLPFTLPLGVLLFARILALMDALESRGSCRHDKKLNAALKQFTHTALINLLLAWLLAAALLLADV